MATKPDRRTRMALILERDGPACVWCGRQLGSGFVGATTEHVVPRAKGGPSWIENEVAACRRCNRLRGHLTPGQWIEECERRGWEPNRDAIVAVLMSLQTAIGRDGGQRRARTYVRSQLRRLEGVEPHTTPAPPPTDAHGRVITRVRLRRSDLGTRARSASSHRTRRSS